MLLPLLVLATSSFAASHTVCASGCAYPKLRDAVSAAAAGDTILVQGPISEGGTVTVSKNLSFVGDAASPRRVIGASNKDILAITAGTVSITGLTLDPTGSAARCILQTGGALTMADSRCESGTGGTGATAAGGGVHVSGTGSATFRRTVFANNSAAGEAGGAVYFSSAGLTLTVENSTFSSNTAQYGGAIYLTAGTLALTGNRFAGNTATIGSGTANGGAVFITAGVSIAGSDNLFCANTAKNLGGGVYQNGTAATVGATWKNNLFVENTAGTTSTNGGGGLYAGGTGAAVLLTNNHWLGNAGAGSAWRSAASVTAVNNLYAWNSHTAVVRVTGTATSTFDAWFANAADTTTVTKTDTAITGDPLLIDYTRNGNCDDDNFLPLWPDSPLINAGATVVSDPDGSRSDIGAFGGPDEIGESPWIDIDGDTWLELYDCDDADADAYPTPWYLDLDGDGSGSGTATAARCTAPTADHVLTGDDCDDDDANVSPTAPEDCLTPYDDDCDDAINEIGAINGATYFRDADGDTWGNATNTTGACSLPAGYVTNDDDCNDSNILVFPGAAERCNGYDDNCDTSVDGSDAIDRRTFWPDDDGDTYGDATGSTLSCSLPTGFSINNDDCDDALASVNPGASEFCNDRDDDCDRVTDESALDADTWYPDADVDGFGLTASPVLQCDAPAGHTTIDGDCDDTRATVNPDATEVCNERDDDCNGETDENTIGAPTWFRDMDSDGFGKLFPQLKRCTQPEGYASVIGDCDDMAASTNPGAPEVCGDGVDNDCDDFGGPSTTDEDGDTLEKSDESAWGGSDCLIDSDGDSIDDVDELGFGARPRNTDGDALVDAVDPDDDNDGVLTLHEAAAASNPYDSDSDADGIPDGMEWGSEVTPRNSDTDDLPDVLDEDDDNDGILTADEADGDADGDAASTAPCAPVGDGVPNYLDADSDGDGTSDATEGDGDADEDFIPNYLDCNDGDGITGDADSDGLSNAVEADLGSDPLRPDSDGDSVGDGAEVGADPGEPTDTDADGVWDVFDEDDDGDGVPTSEEAGLDRDMDGIPDHLDAVDDRLEDDDLDGIPNGVDPAPDNADVDGDGIPDGAETDRDTDGDGTPDALDDDDDGDGIPSADEGAFDADGDGMGNHVDTDADGDGIPDADEGSADPDCDGLPAFLDAADTDGPCANADTDASPGAPTEGCTGCSTRASPRRLYPWYIAGLAVILLRRRARPSAETIRRC